MSEPTALARCGAAGRIALVLVVIAGVGWMLANRGNLGADAIRLAIAQYPAAPLFFLIAHTIASLIFFPRTVLAVAAGALFGLWWGALWAALGSVIGAIAGFLAARYVNNGLVDLENLRRFGPVLRRAERGGWRAVFLLRLIPVIPHSLSNYALGLTRLDLGAYALGSLLGQLPMTIACAAAGAAGETWAAGQTGFIVPTLIGLAALLLSLILPRIVRPARPLDGN
jgi:uncharacterized membrane protein YdjX (TVP38/TMEM64 family)